MSLESRSFDAEHPIGGVITNSSCVSLADAQKAVKSARAESFRQAVQFIRADAKKYALAGFAHESAALATCADGLEDHARGINRGKR